MQICVQLGFPLTTLKQFEGEKDPLLTAVNYWLKGNIEGDEVLPVSWKSIVVALKSKHVGETGLAQEVHSKYCQNEDTGSYSL